MNDTQCQKEVIEELSNGNMFDEYETSILDLMDKNQT